MRWQQFTVPIMAKGLEDTALYVYNPLVSLNEVGTDFLIVSPEDFHQFNRRRQENSPSTLNATTTHDTKRSEDVRMRINVLSEDPQEWEACLKRWSAWNLSKKLWANGMAVPDPNEEYFLYQTLIGAWPLFKAEIPEFKARLQAYTIKAAREAKVHTGWIAPNHEHENALTTFTEAILHESDHNEFLKDFLKIQTRLAYYGALNSLSQVLLKIASPGVPDFYQGTELWDLSLVDPDNRRPVDFHQRAQLLLDLKMKAKKTPESLIQELLRNWQDGAIKLYTTYKALNFRKAHPELFLRGDYIPIMTRGPKSRQVIAFARRRGNSWAVVVVARFFTKILPAEDISFDQAVWQESFLSLPHDAPKEWVNIFTGETIKSIPHKQSRSLDLANLFQNLPVALLFGPAAAPGTQLLPRSLQVS
jgi:(1->4)-alpha-D-glucan 1-alpha-D-glucosylmutase